MARKPSEIAAVVGCIDPDAYSANAYTAVVDMRNYEQIMAVVMAGELGTNATVDAKLEESANSNGSSATALTGKAITQLTQAGTDSDKQAVLNLRADEMTERYAVLTVTVGTATSDVGAVILGFGPNYGPASDYDAATVDEIV